MSLCTTPLTEACRGEIIRIIGHVRPNELDLLLAIEPAFKLGGFRARKPELLRKRLEQIVLAEPEVSDYVRAVLADHSRYATLFRHLSVETIFDTELEWAALLGEHVLIVAFLLDPREEVREQAESWLQDSDHSEAVPQPETAAALLNEQLSDITELLGARSVEHVPITRENWDDQREQLNQRIKALQTENRRLKGVDDKCRRCETMLEREKESTRALSDKIKAFEKTERKLRKELEEVRADLLRETNRREERLKAALDARLAEEFHGWLARARTLESQADELNNQEDVTQFARKALEIQAATDRHSGNRSKLQSRLDTLLQLHHHVQSTLRDAIRQAPELKLAESKLEDEIRHLNALLDNQESLSPLEEALIAKIHSAPDQLLPRLKKLPQEMQEMNLLNRRSVETITQHFKQRLDAIEALGVAPDPESDKKQDGVAILGRALAGKIPAILLLDGHNVLFGLQARYMPPRGRAVPDKAKRDNLIADVTRVAHPNPALRATVFFDGHIRSDITSSPNVRVIYSGGEGEHRADKVIIDQIRFYKDSNPDSNVLLVSNDNDLCKEARRLGAKDISVVDFGAFL